MTIKMWNGVEVASASRVCEMMNEASLCRACTDNECETDWHSAVNADGTDAPTFGETPADILMTGGGVSGVPTTWSWDSEGVVVGGDGSYNDAPFRFIAWADVRAAQAAQ